MKKHAISGLGWTEDQMASLQSAIDKMSLKTEERRVFWQSDLCSRMIADILRTGESLACDDPLYDLQRVQTRFGWSDLSEDTIKMFIAACTDGQAAPIELFMPEEDEDDDWSSWACIKRGLHIHSMSGQGTVYTIRPATSEEIAKGKPDAQ